MFGALLIEQVVLELAERAACPWMIHGDRAIEPSKMSFIASTSTLATVVRAVELRRDRLDAEAIVVERDVLDDGLVDAVAGRVVAGRGVDVHALAGVRDRVVVHVEVDRLAGQAAAGRAVGVADAAGGAGPVEVDGLPDRDGRRPPASEKSARLESEIVNDIGELSWLTGAR